MAMFKFSDFKNVHILKILSYAMLCSLTLLLINVLFCNVAHGDTIGFYVDKTYNETLVNGTVKVDGVKTKDVVLTFMVVNGTDVTVSTDKNGFYRVMVPTEKNLSMCVQYKDTAIYKTSYYRYPAVREFDIINIDIHYKNTPNFIITPTPRTY